VRGEHESIRVVIGGIEASESVRAPGVEEMLAQLAAGFDKERAGTHRGIADF